MDQFKKFWLWCKNLSAITLWLVAAWFAILFAGERLGLGDYLQVHVSSAVNFNIRLALRGDEALDQRIKILAVDDATAALRGETRLSGPDLAKLLEAIDSHKPAKIILDSMFSLRHEAGSDTEQFISRITSLHAPVVSGAMVSSNAIAYRTEIKDDKFSAAWSHIGRLPAELNRRNSTHIYGPEGAFLTAFSRLGHIYQTERSFAPAILANDNLLMPYLSIYAADLLEVDDGILRVNGTAVSLDENGLVPINFISSDVIEKRIMTLSHFFNGNNSVFSNIAPGDLVVILTEYTSGGSRFMNSPFGPVPAPYTLIATMDAALKGKWLMAMGHQGILILALASLGLLLGFNAPTTRFVIWFVGVTLALLVCCVLLFVEFGVEIPWALPILGFIGAALIGHGERRHKESLRRIYLESERQTAAVLQRDFLPPTSVQHKQFDLAATYIAAETIGGDWYAHGVIADRWLYMHLGDVTGHGTASALLASFAKGATDALHEEHRRAQGQPAPLGLVHECLNRIICTSSGDNLFMTLQSMVIDLSTGDYTYLNSGHEPAIILAAGKMTILSQPINNLLGHSIDPQDLSLGSGRLGATDTVLLFSDGLLDATCPPGKKPSLRLLTKLLQNTDQSDATSLKALLELRYKSQLQERRQVNFDDDVTFLIAKMHLVQKTAAAEKAS